MPILGIIGGAKCEKTWLSSKLSNSPIDTDSSSIPNSIALTYLSCSEVSFGVLKSSSWSEPLHPISERNKDVLPPKYFSRSKTSITSEFTGLEDSELLLFDDTKILEEIRTKFVVQSSGIIVIVVNALTLEDLERIHPVKQ